MRTQCPNCLATTETFTDVFSNRFPVIADACVLADVAKRDLILTLAEAELFRLRWSDRILSETASAIQKILQHREDAKDRTEKAIAAMRSGFPEAMDYESATIVDGLDCLPDKNDHHVLASAIACKAVMIVTENLKDFPAEALKPYSIEARSADEFVADTIDLDYVKSIPAIKAMRAKLKNPTMTSQELLERWLAKGMIATSEVLAPQVQNI